LDETGERQRHTVSAGHVAPFLITTPIPAPSPKAIAAADAALYLDAFNGDSAYFELYKPDENRTTADTSLASEYDLHDAEYESSGVSDGGDSDA
jgi:hypothetical protein